MSSPEWVKRVNYLGLIGGARHLVKLDPDEVLEMAQKATGLSDFGAGDLQNFYRYFDLYTGYELDLLSILLLKNRMLRLLCNRLLITEKLKQSPEVGRETINSPIFIVGSPRTGTSILFELLAQDENLRSPLTWEAHCPTAFPGGATEEEMDRKRQQISQTCSDIYMDINPEMKKVHEFRWNLPVECYEILEINFMSASTHEKGYKHWLHEMDPSNSYQWHKKVLQLLQHKKPQKRWLLKCPVHIHFLDAVFNFYPDANIIYTHRDPVRSMSSLLSLYKASSDSKMVDPNLSEKKMLTLFTLFENAKRKVIKERSENLIPERQIADFQFSEFKKDPVLSIQGIYKKFNLQYPKKMTEKILTYLEEKRLRAGGEHEHHLEMHGFSSDYIRERFKFYTDHYNIPAERI